jgi:hypothetical protein
MALERVTPTPLTDALPLNSNSSSLKFRLYRVGPSQPRGMLSGVFETVSRLALGTSIEVWFQDESVAEFGHRADRLFSTCACRRASLIRTPNCNPVRHRPHFGVPRDCPGKARPIVPDSIPPAVFR